MARKICVKLILELRESGLSVNQIASSRHISKHSVSDVFRIAKEKDIRFDCTSTIFCTLYNINEDWTKRLGRGTQAESIVERFRHNSFVIEMGEKNMREIFENPRRKRK